MASMQKRERLCTNEQRRVNVFQANKWAQLQHKIKDACNQWSTEELRLYECQALASWESR